MKPRLKYLLIILISLLVFILLLKYVAPLLTPFIMAIFFSLMIEPLVKLFQGKFGFTRGWSVLSAMFIFITSTFLAAGFITRRLIIELIELSTALPKQSSDIWQAVLELQKYGDRIFLSLPEPIVSNYPKISETFQANINSIINKLQSMTTMLLNYLINTVTGVTGLFIIILVAIIATYFFSRDRGLIIKFWLGLFPAPWGRKSLEVVNDIFQGLIGYIKAQLFLITMTMILTIIGLYIIGAKYALTMGIIIGFFDLLPVLGPGTIYIPWIIYSFLKGDTTFGILLVILYLVVLIIRQTTETKVVSKNIGLHPLATLIAMYVGLQLMGVPGLILGPLIIIAVKAVARVTNITIIK